MTHCFFNDEQTKSVIKLSKGDRVSVRGPVDGLMIDVIVKDCEVVE